MTDGPAPVPGSVPGPEPVRAPPVGARVPTGALAGSDRFPDDVVVALHEAGVTLTCLPVRVDGGGWRAALFYVAPPDAPCLVGGRLAGGPFAVGFEADLHEHESGTVFELGVEIATPVAPLAGTMLFVTGHASGHFEALRLLADQDEVVLHVGDEYCRTLWRQRVPLAEAHRAGLRALLDEAVGRDAVIRLTGRYDAEAAFRAAFDAVRRGPTGP